MVWAPFKYDPGPDRFPLKQLSNMSFCMETLGSDVPKLTGNRTPACYWSVTIKLGNI